MKKIIVFAVIISLLLAAQCFATTFVSLQKTENVNGSIGLYLKNERSFDIHPDSTEYSYKYLIFSIGDENLSVIDAMPEIEPDETRRVVLNKTWPSSGYIKINVTYDDGEGSRYKSDELVVFSDSLSKASVDFGGGKHFSNETLSMTIKLKAGDADAKSINYEFVSVPKYFSLETDSLPGSVPAGEERDFIFTFKPLSAMDEATVYAPIYFPLKVSYTYFGFETYDIFNESVTLFNEAQVKGSDVPFIRLKLIAPSEIIAGESASIKVYAFNDNGGGNSACDVNFTLTSDKDSISIPVSKIVPGEKLESKADFLNEPSATFEISTSKGAALGKVKLKMEVSYRDCILRFMDSESIEKEIEIKAEAEKVETTEEANETVEVIVMNITTEETPTETTTVDEVEEGRGFKFYLLLGLIGAVVLFFVVHILRVRSQYI